MAKDKADLLQGTLALLVLKALQLEPAWQGGGWYQTRRVRGEPPTRQR